MTIRLFSVFLMAIGVLLCIVGLTMPFLPSDPFLDHEQAEEFTRAATDYHAAISVPFSERDSKSLNAAKARFEAAKEAIEIARSRSAWTKRSLQVGGLSLLLVGGVVHLALGVKSPTS
jgi:hypothetical protein